MKTSIKHIANIIALLLLYGCNSTPERWIIDTQEDWIAFSENASNLSFEQGQLHLQGDSAFLSSTIKSFDSKKRLLSLMIRQHPQWNTWKPIPKTTPIEAVDAPVFIPVANQDYWLLARFAGDNKNGYHAWHSTNMKKWTHYGPVSSFDNKWVTSAEHVDGKFYIYFDKPNDEDPHLIIDEDLTDGQQGQEIGNVLSDPSHGSDMAVFRDDDGTFHIIYEDWSPLDASKHSWDSPLAGHSDSPDGINGFLPHEFPPPIDKRTSPTGEIESYEPHPNQLVFGPDPTPYTYEVHKGEQDAFGDYTMIKVGDQYYLFCDYDSHNEEKSMRVGRWRSNDIGKEFIWDGEIGEGFHPDPTIGFAEGKFYLIVQRTQNDFISDGPWVDGVEVRAGIDSNKDGEIDQWTEFTRISETYSRKPGFLRVVESKPAHLDISSLNKGYAFKIEFRIHSTNGFSPVIDRMEIELE